MTGEKATLRRAARVLLLVEEGRAYRAGYSPWGLRATTFRLGGW
jgi:hypothetical protein